MIDPCSRYGEDMLLFVFCLRHPATASNRPRQWAAETTFRVNRSPSNRSPQKHDSTAFFRTSHISVTAPSRVVDFLSVSGEGGSPRSREYRILSLHTEEDLHGEDE